MRIFLWIFLLILSFPQALAYELTERDKVLVDGVIPKFYALIDKWDEDTAGMVLDRVDNILEKPQTERIKVILNYLSHNISEKYEVGKYFIAESPTPLLYTPDFKAQFGWADGLTLNFDSYGEIDALEMVALTGTVFEMKQDMGNGIYQVSTKDYPVENPLYIHKNFVGKYSRVEPEARERNLPSKQEILKRLKSIEGRDYVWGGNDPDGIPEMLELYTPASKISKLKQEQWQLTWLDCSGLIYWATDGYTPRNTSWLIEYGASLDIEWKTLEEIIPLLEPLDIIVWKGHMLVVYDEEHTIESTVSPNGNLAPGVQIRDIEDSLGNVIQKRTPVNNYKNSIAESPFVIMRWYK